MRKLGLAVLLWWVLQGGAWAGFDEGLAAAERGNYATALKEWQPLAEAGDAEAQYNLGVMYANGRGVPKNYTEAIKWFRLAADQGNAHAQYNFGAIYHFGQIVPKNMFEAIKWYRLAAQQGRTDAAFALAKLYHAGWEGVPGNHADAIKWYTQAANKGDVEAQENLASLYESTSGTLNSLSKALHWQQLAAEQGSISAQFKLAERYFEGKGGASKSGAQAIKWYEQVVARHDQKKAYQYSRSLHRLAMIYRDGLLETPKQHKKAFEFLVLAAENQYAPAQYDLAVVYRDGLLGAKKDYQQAAQWMLKAAQAGYTDAEKAMAVLYERGWGVSKNVDEAQRWQAEALKVSVRNQARAPISTLDRIKRYFSGSWAKASLTKYQAAAEAGDAKAQYHYGLMFQYGLGVAIDPQQALIWYRKAAQQRLSVAYKRLGELYFEGAGVQKNNMIAYALLNLTNYDPADPETIFDLEMKLVGQFSPVQFDQAQAISVDLYYADDFLRTLDEAVQQTTEK